MRNLPVYPDAKANIQVDQRNRWFAWGQANSIFQTLRLQRYFMPFTYYDPWFGLSWVTPSNPNVATVPSGAVTVGTEGPVSFGTAPGAANGYFYLSNTYAEYLDCENPVVAVWVKIPAFTLSVERWWVDRLSAGAPNISWGLGLTAANQVLVRLSADGTNVVNINPGNPVSLSVWNFYAFQHESATKTHIIVNGTVTTHNTGLASIFVGGVCDLRMGWKADADIALVALANDNSVNCVQKLLGLYYHSRYAFRDDWT